MIIVPLDKKSLIIEEYSKGNSIRNISRKIKCSRKFASMFLIASGYKIKPGTAFSANNHSSFTKNIIINNGCWEWSAGLNNKGYGQISINGKLWLTHRYSYQYYNGPINGFFVCHKCDNPKCCKPDHLFLGTRQDNINDMIRKGRKSSKLSDADIIEIRKLLSSKGYTQLGVAKMFQIGKTTVGNIYHSRTWKHLQV